MPREVFQAPSSRWSAGPRPAASALVLLGALLATVSVMTPASADVTEGSGSETAAISLAANPNPARITDASWWLMEQLRALQPGSLNGGIYDDKPGYHNTRAANLPTDYSVRDAEDQGGPSDKAAAYDWTFPEAQSSTPNYRNIAIYCNRLLASGRDPGDPRLDGWREFLGQTDNDGVAEGYDFRYDTARYPDTSHLWHIHLSEDRNKVTNLDNKIALLSVLRGETVEQWRGGSVYHRVRNLDGTWTPFGGLSLGSVSRVATAVDPSARAHTLAVQNGKVWHRLRNADGTWSPWVMLGNPGAASAIAASTDNGGNLHVTIAADGQVYHRIRLVGDSTWTPWGGLDSTPIGTVTAVSTAVDTSRSITHVAVVANGRVFHRVRNTAGAWTQWALLGNPGTASAVGASADSVGNLHVTIAADGIAYHLVGNAGTGAWTPWGNLGSAPLGTVTAVSAAVDTVRGTTHVAVIANGAIWHRLRNTDGAWTVWGQINSPSTAVAVAVSTDPTGVLHTLAAA